MIADTVRTLFASGDLPGILHEIEILMEDRARVRAENEGYKHEIRRLTSAFANITEPTTGRPIAEPRLPKPSQNNAQPNTRQNNGRPKVEPKSKPTKDALDDLDL